MRMENQLKNQIQQNCRINLLEGIDQDSFDSNMRLLMMVGYSEQEAYWFAMKHREIMQEYLTKKSFNGRAKENRQILEAENR